MIGRSSLHGYGKRDFGAYQSFCEAQVEFDHGDGAAGNYRRTLDLERAVATVRYTQGGADYRREYFCSHPDQMAVMRFHCSNPGGINLKLGAIGLHENTTVRARGNELVLSGQVDTGDDKHEGMRFEAKWIVTAKGGTVLPDEDGRKLMVRNASTVMIVMAGATDYKLAYPRYKGDPPELRNQRTLDQVRAKSYARFRGLREWHQYMSGDHSGSAGVP